VTEGIYWPQQSRFARSWFAPRDRTTANSLIQYYGQYLALAIGFMVLTPIYDAFGWRVLFFITGGLGLLVIVPLYSAMLGRDRDAPFQERVAVAREPLNLAAFGGAPFLLLLFSYITQGMLFWGITLWIPLAVRSLGFTGWSQAFASAIPYFVAVALAYPIARVSDRTGERVLIAGLGLLLPGIVIVLLPLADSPLVKMGLITIAMGYYAGSYTPNIWSIIQSSVRPHAVGPAAGIVNGLGAGGGGTVAGFLVGMLFTATGSYIPGFMVLGGLVILGGIALLVYRRIVPKMGSI
jgi:MFS family permease